MPCHKLVEWRRRRGVHRDVGTQDDAVRKINGFERARRVIGVQVVFVVLLGVLHGARPELLVSTSQPFERSRMPRNAEGVDLISHVGSVTEEWLFCGKI